MIAPESADNSLRPAPLPPTMAEFCVMWNRYRKWKPTLGSVLTCGALLLMTGQPEASTRWHLGGGIAAVLVLVYVVEEIVWMARNQGRPCAKCGWALRLKPFRLHLRCPHCGEAQ